MKKKGEEFVYEVQGSLFSKEDFKKQLDILISKNKELEIRVKILESIKIKLEKKIKDVREKNKTFLEKTKIDLKEKFKEFENSKSKYISFYNYVFFEKRKNRSHRRKIEEHKKCSNCQKSKNNTKFFSFEIKSQLIVDLKDHGFEDCIYFDEKNVCPVMEKILVKAISFLSIKYHSKAVLWYRNFLVKKHKGISHQPKMNSNVSNTQNLDTRFYNTYLSSIVCNKNIPIEDFLQNKNKKRDYYNSYQKFDNESYSKTTFYGLDKHDYHIIKKNKKNKLYREFLNFTNSETINEDILEKEEFNSATHKQRLTSKKYRKKLKKL